MRRDNRGNVILTALFVAIFLFFLSVALLWTNRQDIALSLSMEHKLKAQALARSAAMRAYGELRKLGELRMPLESAQGNVKTKVQLVRLPAGGRGGDRLLVRVRSTSGPVSAYFTLHLQETALTSESNPDAVAIFPGSQTEASAVYGDFRLTALGSEVSGDMASNRGPVVRSLPAVEPTRPAFNDVVPVFDQMGEPQAFGPVLAVASPGEDETVFSWMRLEGGSLEWVDIPAPENLSGQPFSAQGSQLITLTTTGTGWSDIALQGRDGVGAVYRWRDVEPPTSSPDEADDLAAVGSFDGGAVKPWGEVPHPPTQQWFTTRGKVAADGMTLYSHAWHYLYRPYQGGSRSPVTPIDGSRLTRWPCILSCNLGSGTWSKVWTPLNESGQVTNPVKLDTTVLAVGEGSIFAVSESVPKQVLDLTSGTAKAVKPLLPGTLFVYRKEPWVAFGNGFRNLLTDQVIGFETLPRLIPEVEGPLVELPQLQTVGIDEAGTNDISPDGALESEQTAPRTVSPEYALNYQLLGRPAVMGDDILVQLRVEVGDPTSTHPVFNQDFVDQNKPVGGLVVARFDGTQWHILPNGLRAFLDRQRHQAVTADESSSSPETTVQPQAKQRLDAPGGSDVLLLAQYSGLHPRRHRYAFVSIDTSPFEFTQ